MHPLTLGTAGHIDHGKTVLVRALTGVDTDRLPEEQRARDLDRARLRAARPAVRPPAVGGRRAGARALRPHDGRGRDRHRPVPDGRRRRRRRDAADARARRGAGRARGDARAWWRSRRPTSPTPRARARRRRRCCRARRSSRSRRPRGEGLEELRAALDRVAAALPGRSGGGALRLHVDRSFTIRGAGTVVTGTLWEGAAARGDEVRILPSGLSARVRSVQVHDEPRERAEAGQRVALNLAGVGRDEVARGDVVVRGRPRSAAGGGCRRPPEPRSAWTSRFRGSRPTRGRTAARASPCTTARARRPPGSRSSAAATSSSGSSSRWCPPAATALVIRSLAPPDTLGGGVVLDPDPPRHGPSRDLLARLARLERGEPEPEAPPAPEPPRRPEPAPLSPAALELEERLKAAGLEPPPDEAPQPSSPRCASTAAIVRLGRDMHLHRDALDDVAPNGHAGLVAEGRRRSPSPPSATSSTPAAATPRPCWSSSTPSA